MNERPTLKQLRYLRYLGFDGKAPETLQEARMLIDFIRRRA